jgi:hypothetical protein
VIRYDGTDLVDLNLEQGLNVTGIWGSGEENIYVVYDYRRARRFDGTSWSEVDFGFDVSPHGIRIVAGATADNVLMCDYETLFFDGSDWAKFPHDPYGQIVGLWCQAANDYYGVTEDRVVHFDGAGWSEVFRLPGYADDWDLTGVWADATGSVYAAGEYGDLWRYSGGELTFFNRSVMTITGIWAAAANDAYAVTDRGAYLHFDGKEWS